MTDVKKPYENMLVRKSQDGSNGVYVEFNDTANTAAQKERLAVTTTVAALDVSDDSLALAVLHHARDQINKQIDAMMKGVSTPELMDAAKSVPRSKW